MADSCKGSLNGDTAGWHFKGVAGVALLRHANEVAAAVTDDQSVQRIASVRINRDDYEVASVSPTGLHGNTTAGRLIHIYQVITAGTTSAATSVGGTAVNGATAAGSPCNDNGVSGSQGARAVAHNNVDGVTSNIQIDGDGGGSTGHRCPVDGDGAAHLGGGLGAAVRDAHGACRSVIAVFGSHSDVGCACGHTGHNTVGDGGDLSIVAVPGYVLVGGVRGSDSDVQGAVSPTSIDAVVGVTATPVTWTISNSV